MDLSTLRTKVALDLDDGSGTVWTTSELDRAIERALYDYSRAAPRRAETTLTLAVDGREVDLSGVAGLVGVERVWYPYDGTEPAWPAGWCQFEVWPGDVLYLDVASEPAAGESLRLFYSAAHTLDGLDDATATTLPEVDMHGLAAGAAGYAALSRARGAIGTLGPDGRTPDQWLAWAQARRIEFEEFLVDVACRAAAECGPVSMA